MADHVPLRRGVIAQSIAFPSNLLHTIFSERANAGGVSLADLIGRDHLGDGHQFNVRRTAVCAASRGVDLFPYSRDVVCDAHAKQEPLRTLRYTKENLCVVPSC